MIDSSRVAPPPLITTLANNSGSQWPKSRHQWGWRHYPLRVLLVVHIRHTQLFPPSEICLVSGTLFLFSQKEQELIIHSISKYNAGSVVLFVLLFDNTPNNKKEGKHTVAVGSSLKEMR